jgi:iron uptake system component EfeO
LNKARLFLVGLAIGVFVAAVGGATYFLARPNAAPPLQAAGAPPSTPPRDAPVTMNVSASACEPNELTVPAGRVTFAIHNLGARALEWEILNGVIVVDERENIAPGFTQKLTTKLEPGDYDITCGLLSNPKGKLHVAALAGASVKPTQVDLIGPLAEYRVYASYEIDALAEDAKRLADAVKAGDFASARALFPAAHAHYARIAPIVGMFPDLDSQIDARAGDRGAQGADPASTGFHRLELALFASPAPEDIAPLADKLVADVGALQVRFEDLAMSPAPTIAGAADVLAKTAPARINGDGDSSSRAELGDLEANLEGVKKIVDLFQPLIEKSDRPLSRALAEDFAAVEATLAKYKTADGVYEPAAALSVGDRMALQSMTKKLAGELTRVGDALGLS